MTRLIPDIAGPVGQLIEQLGVTPGAKSRIENEVRQLQIKGEAQAQRHVENMVANQRDIVVAEVKGQSWMQRNWRPSMMFVFITIIAFQYLVAPIFAAFGISVQVHLPSEFWTLTTLGVSGYLGLRSVEKIAPAAVDAITGKREGQPVAPPPVVMPSIDWDSVPKIEMPPVETPRREVPPIDPKNPGLTRMEPKSPWS